MKKAYYVCAIAYDKDDCPIGDKELKREEDKDWATAFFCAYCDRAEDSPKAVFGDCYPDATCWHIRLEECYDDEAEGTYCIDILDDYAVIIEEDNT